MKHEYKICKIFQNNGNWRRHYAFVVKRNETIEEFLEDFVIWAVQRPGYVNDKDSAKTIAAAFKMMTIVHRSSKHSDYNNPGYEEHRFKYYSNVDMMKIIEKALTNLQLSSINTIDASL